MTTGGQGNAIVWIATSNVGQAEYLTACADFCSSGDHGVGYSGIHWVEEKPEWIHTGGHTTGHGGNEFNHWMTSSAAWGIWYTAVEYLDRYPTQGQIAVNDMSLPFGGIFDLNQNWQGPHDAHSWGTAVDVRGNGGFLSIPVGPQLDEFVQICEDEGAIEAGIHSPGTSNQHIHCRWPH